MAEEKKEKQEPKHGKKGHGFHHTHVEWHKDGSATIHHEHEIPAQSVKHAAADLDSVHDSLEDHVREPEPNENEPEPESESTPADVLATQGNTPNGTSNTTPIVNS